MIGLMPDNSRIGQLRPGLAHIQTAGPQGPGDGVQAAPFAAQQKNQLCAVHAVPS